MTTYEYQCCYDECTVRDWQTTNPNAESKCPVCGLDGRVVAMFGSEILRSSEVLPPGPLVAESLLREVTPTPGPRIDWSKIRNLKDLVES